MNSLHSIAREITIELSDDEKRAVLAWNAEQNTRLRYSRSLKRLQWHSRYTEQWTNVALDSWSREYFYIRDSETSYPRPLPLDQFDMSMIDVVA